MNNLSKRMNIVILLLFLCLPVILPGCLDAGEQSTPVPTVINASPEATAPLADPTSAPAAPVLTSTATRSPIEIATATPTADLPVAPVMGARGPDFTLADLNGNEVSLSGLRGQPVLLNFWTTW